MAARGRCPGRFVAAALAAACLLSCLGEQDVDLRSLPDGDLADASDTADSPEEADAELPPPETWLWRIHPAGPGVVRGYATSFVETDDGGVVLAGWAMRLSDEAGTTWLSRVDAAGRVVWDETFSDGGVGWPGALARHPEGGFVVAGGRGAGPELARIAPDGTPLWRKAFPRRAGFVRSLHPTADGFVAGGRIGGTGGSPWLARLDADAHPIWQKSVPVDGAVWQNGVVPARDGGYLAAALLGDSTHEGVWIARLDADGAVAWQRRVSTGTASPSYDAGILEAANGDVVVATNAGGVLVLRFDPSGGLRESLLVGGDGGSRGGYLTDGPEGGLVLAAMEDGLTPESHNLWLVGLSADGRSAWQGSVTHSELEDAVGLLPSRDGGFLAVSGGCCCSTVVKLRLDGSFDGPCPALVETHASVVRLSPAVDDPGFVLEDFTSDVVEETVPVVVPGVSSFDEACR